MLSRGKFQIEAYNAVGDTAFFRRLVREWENVGGTIGVHRAVSDSTYRSAKTLGQRLRLRWQMYPGYAMECWRNAKRSPRSIRVVTTNPFFAPALVARSAQGRGATINLLYDLYPDALIQAGKISPNGWMARRLTELTRTTLRRCDATVFLGERLKAYAENRYGPARHAAVIPVGADGDFFKHYPPAQESGPVRILYCGQLGRMHDADTIAGVLGETIPGVEFTFRASGAGFRNLQQKVGSRAGVVWGGALSDAEWTTAMLNTAVALVTVAQGAERVVMPSKTYSALVAGQAILAVCPRESDLADLVLRHDCGWVIEPGDVAGLRRVLAWIATHPEALMEKRLRAYEVGHTHYDMGALASEWRRLFEQVQESTGMRGKAVSLENVT